MIPLKLLIGTVNSLILWDGGIKKINDLGTHGITWDKTNFFAATYKYEEGNLLSIFDKYYNRVKKIDKRFSDAHQIIYADNDLFVINSSKDAIYKYRENVWFLFNNNKFLKSNDLMFDNRDDYNHFNSIWFNKGLFYILSTRPKVLYLVDKQFNVLNRIQIKTGTGEHGLVHNIYEEYNKYYTLEKEGLGTFDNSGNFKYLYKCGGFMRGLSRTKDFWIIGESQEKERKDRPKGDSWIHILDNEFNLIKKILLLDQGEIRDIRTIDQTDYAH